MYTYDFIIAGKVFRLNLDHEIVINYNFVPFQVVGFNPDSIVEFKENSKITYIDKVPVFRNISYEIIPTETGYLRQYRDYKNGNRLYAISLIDKEGKEEKVEFCPEFSNAFSESQNSFSHIAIEELLLNHQRMILHASFINTEFGGILFSGPSGAGKSTQANLWAEYEQAEIINGDRPILGKENNKWRAWGSPYAGSSGYHVSKDFPITAIIVLSHGKENLLKKMDKQSAFRSLYSQVTVNGWNTEFVNQVADMVLDLIQTVPVYYAECTPDIHAVEMLKKRFMEEVV